MPSLDPATVVPAVAALGGVALTIVSQAVVSRGQRRSDRTTKLFDAKFELYTEVYAVLESIGSGIKEVVNAQATVDEFQGALKVARERYISATSALAEFQKEYLRPDRTLDPGSAKEGQELVREFNDAIQAASSLSVKVQEWIERKEWKGSLDTLLVKHSKLRELGPRIRLIADEEVSYQFAIAIQTILIKRDLDPLDTISFQRAIRKELGVQDSRVRTSINRIRKWYHGRRLRSRIE